MPLFTEELTKAVLERGADFGLPESLHDSLMARLDRIPSAKAVAQLGSVIGRSFSHQLISALAELPEAALSEALDQLTASGLASPTREAPAGDVYVQARAGERRGLRGLLEASTSAARQDRRNPRGTLAGTTGLTELLAHHYAKAELAERSVGYWRKAADRAIGRFAISRQSPTATRQSCNSVRCRRRPIGYGLN